MDYLSEIKKEEVKKLIIERCGSETPDKQGIKCTHCGAREVYADPTDPTNTKKWAWMIGAYKVDDSSECKNCKRWF